MVRAARHEVIEHHDGRPQPYENTVFGGCNTDALGRNRVPASCTCIADKCAMWRWKPGRAVTKRSASPHNPHVQFSDTVHESPTHGYCGLAGHHAS